ncbi:MAG: flavin reductase family protein [Spirochaetes bacterium]|nr:flavin reductase family protein [Spirochaetota bacterium]
MKKIDLKYAYRLINHGPLVVVSARYNNSETFTPISWNMPVEHEPPLVAITVSKENFVDQLIHRSKSFCLNILEAEHVRRIIRMGEVSGKDVDKIAMTGMSKAECKKINAPYLLQSIGVAECELIKTVTIEEVDIFIARVVYARANDKFKNGLWDGSRIRTVHHLGKYKFVTTKELKY